MSFEELESLWSAQRPAPARPADLATLKQRLGPELRRRRRFFGYELFCLSIGLVLTPLLAVVNARYAPPAQPMLYWLRVGLVVTALLAFLVATLRRRRRHLAMADAGMETLTAFATKSLALIESEMRDYQLGLRALPLWVGLLLLSIYVNQPPALVGWTPLLLRAGFSLAFVAAIGAVCWRHYHHELKPEHARRKHMLAELS